MKQRLSLLVGQFTSHLLERKYTILISILFALFLQFFVGFELALFIWIFLVCLISKISYRPIVVIALGMLIFIPIFLIVGEQNTAQLFGVYTYYLLFTATLLEIVHVIEKFVRDDKHIHSKGITDTMILRNPFKTVKIDDIYRSTQKLKNKVSLHEISSSITSINQHTSVQVFLTNIFSFWTWIVYGLFILIPISIFRFAGLPSFRDMLVVPYYHNINAPDLQFIEQMIFNRVTSFLPANVISSLFFILIFALGSIFTYTYIIKIQQLTTDNIRFVFSRTNYVFVLVITLLITYNPFTFERFLMGQYTVIRGHVFFIPVLYYIIKCLSIFTESSFHIRNFFEDRYISIYIRLCWALTLITLLSTHHAMFALLLIVVGIIGICIARFKALVEYFKKTHTSNTIGTLIKTITTAFLILSPTFLILFLRVIATAQRTTFDKYKALIPGYENSIISSFSVSANEGQNLILRTLIGSASWNTPSFIEVTGIEEQIGFFRQLTPYFSLPFTLLFLVFLVGCVGIILTYIEKQKHILFTSFMVILPIIVLLVFGYSGSFENLNRWFYALPLSMVFREAGKWYSLMIIIIFSLTAMYYQHLKKPFIIGLITVGTMLGVGNIIPFIPLSSNIIYAEYSDIFTEVSSTCKRGENSKVLYLPFSTYIYPSYSNVFAPNPAPNLLDCSVIRPDYAALQLPDNPNSSIILSSTNESASIISIVKDFILSNKQTSPDGQEIDPYKTLRIELKRLGVSTLIVDDYNYDGSDESEPNLELFNSKLQQSLKPSKVEKSDSQSVALYYLD